MTPKHLSSRGTVIPVTPRGWNAKPVPPRVAERAYLRRAVDVNGCWISVYSVASHGYAQIGWSADNKTHMVLAHRASWVHVNGQLPEGVTLDHTCKTKTCVNPTHLRTLSNFENARRTNGDDWPIGECINGHSNELLMSLSDGTAICETCRKAYNARYNWRTRHPGEPLPDRLLLRREVDLTA